jgi:hypothetical protein
MHIVSLLSGGFTIMAESLVLPGRIYIKVHLYLRTIHSLCKHNLSFHMSRKRKWLNVPFWGADTHGPSPSTRFWQQIVRFLLQNVGFSIKPTKKWLPQGVVGSNPIDARIIFLLFFVLLLFLHFLIFDLFPIIIMQCNYSFSEIENLASYSHATPERIPIQSISGQCTGEGRMVALSSMTSKHHVMFRPSLVGKNGVTRKKAKSDKQ